MKYGKLELDKLTGSKVQKLVSLGEEGWLDCRHYELSQILKELASPAKGFIKDNHLVSTGMSMGVLVDGFMFIMDQGAADKARKIYKIADKEPDRKLVKYIEENTAKYITETSDGELQHGFFYTNEVTDAISLHNDAGEVAIDIHKLAFILKVLPEAHLFLSKDVMGDGGLYILIGKEDSLIGAVAAVYTRDLVPKITVATGSDVEIDGEKAVLTTSTAVTQVKSKKGRHSPAYYAPLPKKKKFEDGGEKAILPVLEEIPDDVWNHLRQIQVKAVKGAWEITSQPWGGKKS